MVEIRYNGKLCYGEKGQLLSDILMKSGKGAEHLCAGRGVCKKCAVKVNGQVVLSCQYKVQSDITVESLSQGEIFSLTGAVETGERTENMCLCLDIGTTTLALGFVSLDGKSIVKVITATNPQRAFGADVISRIDYCTKNGVEALQKAVIKQINSMIDELCEAPVEKMYVAANATMLHILSGEDCSSIGVAPYNAVFLEKRVMQAQSVGIKNVEEIEILPSVHSFVGADIVAGINFAGFPSRNKYNLLVDLGTNAEIALYSETHTVCTSAAAGPCFEGANISCGMSAVNGAIYSYKKGNTKTIGGEAPTGVCGTGLVDIIAELLKDGTIDETGYMEEDFELAAGVVLTQGDVRQYQLAKSAVYSGIITLLREQGVTFENIENVFVSGGFSAELNIENAVRTGLLPEELADKCRAVNNSCLLGTVKYALEGSNLEAITENGAYIDLSSVNGFSDLFIENMMF